MGVAYRECCRQLYRGVHSFRRRLGGDGIEGLLAGLSRPIRSMPTGAAAAVFAHAPARYQPDAVIATGRTAHSKAKYKHVDKLFKATIDWVLIEQHRAELMQRYRFRQARSRRCCCCAGSPESRKNRLYRRARSAPLLGVLVFSQKGLNREAMQMERST